MWKRKPLRRSNLRSDRNQSILLVVLDLRWLSVTSLVGLIPDGRHEQGPQGFSHSEPRRLTSPADLNPGTLREPRGQPPGYPVVPSRQRTDGNGVSDKQLRSQSGADADRRVGQ